MKKSQQYPIRLMPPSRRPQVPTQRILPIPKPNPRIPAKVAVDSPATLPPSAEQKEAEPVPQPIQIINAMAALDVQHLSFDQLWASLTAILDGPIMFNLVVPEPATPLGEQLMKHGTFFIILVKILHKSAFVSLPAIIKLVRSRHLPDLTEDKELLKAYLVQLETIQTPIKVLQSPSLKRSTLESKSSPRKMVQPKPIKIFDPEQEEYKGIRIKQAEGLALRYDRNMEKVRERHGYLLDYFDIDLIYFQSQVQVKAILGEYDNKYVVLQVRNWFSDTESPCLAVISPGLDHQQSVHIFMEIEKQFDNLCYLETDDCKSQEEMLEDSLPDDQFI